MTPWDAKMAGPQLPVMYSTPVLKHEEEYLTPIDASHVTVIKISPSEDDNAATKSGTPDMTESDQNEADYTKLEYISSGNQIEDPK